MLHRVYKITMRLIILAAFLAAPASAQIITDLGSGSHQGLACPANKGTGLSSTIWANYPFHDFCATNNEVMLPWSSCDVLTTQHLLVCFGGGHSDYHGQELYAFNYHSGVWSRLRDPDQWCGNGNGNVSDTAPQCGANGLSPNFSGIFQAVGGPGCAISTPQDCLMNENLGSGITPAAGHAFNAVTGVPTSNSVFISPAGNAGGSEAAPSLGCFGCGSSPSGKWQLRMDGVRPYDGESASDHRVFQAHQGKRRYMIPLRTMSGRGRADKTETSLK